MLKESLKWSTAVDIALREKWLIAALVPLQEANQLITEILWIEDMKRVLAKDILAIVRVIKSLTEILEPHPSTHQEVS